MQEWEDYYKILQVHFLAESEIIVSAYKNLAKKYHPDINKNSVAIDIMKNINIAYETLTDINKRKEYNIEWLKRQEYDVKKNYRTISFIDEILACEAKVVLSTYFNSILNKDYLKAYNYISENDKKHISINQFIKWQETVAKVFQLSDFQCETLKCDKMKILNQTSFEKVIEFNVKVVEKNLIMDRIEEDEVIKQTVMENKKWSVYIGYKQLSLLIDKFEKLAKLTNKKQHIISEENFNTDFLTGFLNKKGLLEKAFLEIERYKRYGNIFSIIMCQIIYKDEFDISSLNSNKDIVLKQVSELISQSIRVLDIPCRWDNNIFLILLPETNFHATLIVIEKIKSIIENRDYIESRLYSVKLNAVENKYKDINELIECID